MRALLFVVIAVGLAAGCASANKQVKTPRYTLSMPDFWEVKGEGLADGTPTTVFIGRYGSAIIDSGSGSINAPGMDYESVQADVQVRVYAWPQLKNMTDPTLSVLQLLAGDSELKLTRHVRLPDQPPECGLLRKKYDILKVPTEPLDMVSRPGWRTIVLGAAGGGSLLGVVARVEFEQDVARYCHNLRNMQVQLQNLLDVLDVVQQPTAAPVPPPPPS